MIEVAGGIIDRMEMLLRSAYLLSKHWNLLNPNILVA
jgi:hypothetical protein